MAVSPKLTINTNSFYYPFNLDEFSLPIDATLGPILNPLKFTMEDSKGNYTILLSIKKHTVKS